MRATTLTQICCKECICLGFSSPSQVFTVTYTQTAIDSFLPTALMTASFAVLLGFIFLFSRLDFTIDKTSPQAVAAARRAECGPQLERLGDMELVG